MDCVLKFIYWSILTTLLYTAVQPCTITERYTGCMYTVFCNTHAGPVNNPGCNSNPNVTFIIQNSVSLTLTVGFFSSTNFDSRVRSFKGQYNNWETIEYQAFKYYRGAISVDLSKNNLKTIEDGAFVELKGMEYLNLSNNHIQYLSQQSLKVSDAYTGALISLDLSNNNLTSLENKVFSHFPSLQNLYLQNNQIKHLSEASFSNLNALKYLMIKNNKICSINMTLALLSELTHLDISNNCIDKLGGFEMIRLVSLEHLNMSNNSIQSVDHTTFTQLTKLISLDLSNNKISSPIESNMFANNHVLIQVDLSNNEISTISPKVFQFSDLFYLNLENNNITGEITSEMFKRLHNVPHLNLSYQHIEAIRNNSFSEMENLNYLNLSNNFINIIEDSSFVNASSLTILDISFNKIKTLDFLKKFHSNLTEMYINNNNVLIVPENLFANHFNLKILDISNNNIMFIGQSALPLYNLEILGINSNNISGIVTYRVFSPANRLRYLDLSNFQLEKLNESALIELPLVTKLNISHNHLDFIHPNNFKGVDTMDTLDLSYNNLTNITLDTQLKNVHTAFLNNNRLTAIPNIFGNDSKLENLNISFNQISNLRDAALKNLKKLQILYASFNRLTYFNNEYTNSLSDLSVLSVSSNQLTEMINLTYFKNLRQLNISNNEITYINSSYFQNGSSLKVLSLSGNKIKTINPGTFQHLAQLVILDLSSNEIANLRFGAFRSLNQTKIIKLSRNQLTNLNFEVFHECPKLANLVIDYNFISTINVHKVNSAIPKLVGLSIGGNPIACEEIIQSKRILNESSFSITSLDKVYHEDNAHGIKCGNDSNDQTVETTTATVTDSNKSDGVPTVSLLFVWCGILSAVVIGAAVVFYVSKRKHSLVVERESRMQFQNSTNSECYSDLLN